MRAHIVYRPKSPPPPAHQFPTDTILFAALSSGNSIASDTANGIIYGTANGTPAAFIYRAFHAISDTPNDTGNGSGNGSRSGTPFIIIIIIISFCAREEKNPPEPPTLCAELARFPRLRRTASPRRRNPPQHISF